MALAALGPTKHRTGPHRTAPDPKTLGNGINQTPAEPHQDSGYVFGFSLILGGPVRSFLGV